MDRNELKVQALLEKVSAMTAQYENQVAELRVDYTIAKQENEQLQARVAELEAQVEASQAEEDPADDAD